MRYILTLFISIISLFAIELQEGDIVYTYNSDDPIDIVLKNYLETRYTHSYIYHDGELWSMTIDYIGDRGKLDTLDRDEVFDSDTVAVYRPKNE